MSRYDEREEIERSIQYYDRRINTLQNKINQLKKNLEMVYAFKQKYERSCNEFLTNLDSRRKKLDGINQLANRMKSARIYHNHASELLNGSLFSRSVDQTDEIKRTIRKKADCLEQEIHDKEAEIRTCKAKISSLYSRLSSLDDD